MKSFDEMTLWERAVFVVSAVGIIAQVELNILAPFPPEPSQEITRFESLDRLVDGQVGVAPQWDERVEAVPATPEVSRDAAERAEAIERAAEITEHFWDVAEAMKEGTRVPEPPAPFELPEDIAARQAKEREVFQETAEAQRENLEARTANLDERQQSQLLAQQEIAIDGARNAMEERHAAERAEAERAHEHAELARIQAIEDRSR